MIKELHQVDQAASSSQAPRLKVRKDLKVKEKATPKTQAKATPKAKYTRDRSANQRRGRTATLSRSSLKERFSLDGLLTSSPSELTEICIDFGILERKKGTCACGEEAWKLESRDMYCNWRCRKCRKCQTVTNEASDLFAVKLPLRSLLGSLWIFCAPLGLSPDKAGLVLGIDHRSTRTLFSSFC